MVAGTGKMKPIEKSAREHKRTDENYSLFKQLEMDGKVGAGH